MIRIVFEFRMFGKKKKSALGIRKAFGSLGLELKERMGWDGLWSFWAYE